MRINSMWKDVQKNVNHGIILLLIYTGVVVLRNIYNFIQANNFEGGWVENFCFVIELQSFDLLIRIISKSFTSHKPSEKSACVS